MDKAIPTDGGPWVPIHVGLLDDERFADLTMAQRGAFITLYLKLPTEPIPGWFKDRQRVVWFLTRQGTSKDEARDLTAALNEIGWFDPDPDSHRLTLHKWDHYTGHRARKAALNRLRHRSGMETDGDG